MLCLAVLGCDDQRYSSGGFDRLCTAGEKQQHSRSNCHRNMKIFNVPQKVSGECGFVRRLAGCKMNNIGVVYTPWSNLKKTGDMDVGQIGFHRQKEVRRIEALVGA